MKRRSQGELLEVDAEGRRAAEVRRRAGSRRRRRRWSGWATRMDLKAETAREEEVRMQGRGWILGGGAQEEARGVLEVAGVHGPATVVGGEDAGSRKRRPAGQEQSNNRSRTCASMKSSSSERLQERA